MSSAGNIRRQTRRLEFAKLAKTAGGFERAKAELLPSRRKDRPRNQAAWLASISDLETRAGKRIEKLMGGVKMPAPSTEPTTTVKQKFDRTTKPIVDTNNLGQVRGLRGKQVSLYGSRSQIENRAEPICTGKFKIVCEHPSQWIGFKVGDDSDIYYTNRLGSRVLVTEDMPAASKDESHGIAVNKKITLEEAQRLQEFEGQRITVVEKGVETQGKLEEVQISHERLGLMVYVRINFLDDDYHRFCSFHDDITVKPVRVGE